MNRPSFNVLTEPWIPIVHHDGRLEELGLLACLERAHELREIRDPAPIIEFGLYRLLVAFVLDALILAGRRPKSYDDLEDLMQEGCLDKRLLRQYIEQCGDVFNLFHPERPFLQTKIERANAKPLAGLFPASPSGTNVNHWHHQHEKDLSVSCSLAVKMLTTIAPFMTAGGAGLSPSINGAPAIYALPTGNNLLETVLLNIPIRNRDSGSGVAAWRCEHPPGKERTQATAIESLSWRPRQIQLIPEVLEDGAIGVRTMIFEKGDSTRLVWFDAGLAYRFDKDKVSPIRMRENRPVWRDAGPLLLLNQQEIDRGEKKVAFRRPDVVNNAFELMGANKPVRIQTYGMRSDMKMKIFEWVKSILVVPTSLGRSTRLGSVVYQEILRADQAAFDLRKRLKHLYPRDGAGNKQALGRLIDRCERNYWRFLESHFHRLLSDFSLLKADAPDDKALIDRTAAFWREAIVKLILEQFDSAAEDMDADSDALQRMVRARSGLQYDLRKVYL